MDSEFQASPAGYEKVLRAYDEQEKTKEYIADQANCSRSTLNKFIAGQPVDKQDFRAICAVFGLNYREIVDGIIEEEPGSDLTSEPLLLRPIDILVKTIRQQVNSDILARCGQMRILDMEKPIKYNDIYINPNILEEIPSRERVDFAELLMHCQSKDFERLSLGKVQLKKVSGREVADRLRHLIVWGKPGSGKTAFLKRLAMLGRSGDFQGMSVPVFITLRDYAAAAKQLSLLEYVRNQWSACGITEHPHAVFDAGLAVVLLDGLDQVNESDYSRVLLEIWDLANHYPGCKIVITSRFSSQKCHLPNFVEVELADFDEEQIADFVTKWFNAESDLWKADQMLDKLQCYRPIQELATNPLLLTWLCLNFVDETSFPGNRSEIYQEGLNIFLKRWHGKHNINQTKIYRKLGLIKSEDFLSRLAFDTFERGEYYFPLIRVEQHISEYIGQLPNAATEEADRRMDSQEIIKSLIEYGLLVERAQGIFSFPHLTWHEHLSAQRIVNALSTQEQDFLPRWLQRIIDHRWREVFFGVVGILPDASNCLLMIKQEIDGMLAADETLQNFLVWLNEKCRSNQFEEDNLKLRLFYLFLDLSLARYVSVPLDLSRSRTIPFSLDLGLYLSLFRSQYLAQAIANASNIGNADFLNELQELQQQLPTQDEDFPQWREEHLTRWRERLRSLMIQYRNIGHDWRFNSHQQESLGKYYVASKLLKDCLDSGCYVNLRSRQYIVETFACSTSVLKQHPNYSDRFQPAALTRPKPPESSELSELSELSDGQETPEFQ